MPFLNIDHDLKKLALAIGLMLVTSQGLAQRAEGPFGELSGHWSGAGEITMANGASERIRCRATYAVNGGGTTLRQNLRCASDSYKLDINASVASEGGALSGNWTETTRNVSGSVSGRATGSDIQAHVGGQGFSASLAVKTKGGHQTVLIRPGSGTDVASVSITLRKV
ncbi:hypothetical protein [Methylocapsa palsarum]|uniref:Uncharacterized protein n=1 Tax=Methylocapsa palsarum TaxID=1612308 RepID=A0A1I3XIE7_9HYPH|nr:hypothetical protein [Methylocapsa palsarum]SFK19354.1 hypothetical protein SAMN05444581_103167 [Methylocapsa palsarum]